MSNVPKLRFKEFSGEWEIKPLSQVAGMKAGKFVKASDISNNQEDKMYPCYGGNGLRGYVKSHTHNGTYPLIGRQGALCGNIQLASGKFHATEHAVVVTPTDKNDILWLYYELDRLNLNRFATGQAQPGLSVEVIQQVKTNIPLKQEQEKIASFLVSVDTKIEQLTKKETLLSSYKKGVMQKIFSGEIRFKADDGSEFCEWEEKKLEDFTELQHGDGDWILSKDITSDGEHKIVQLGNIGLGVYIEKDLKTVSSETFIELKGTPIHKGDLLINRMVDNNLNSCIFNLDGNYITSVDVCWIRENQYFNNYFLMSLMITAKSQQKLLSLSSGSGRVRISKKNLFEKFIFELPCLEEQTKIANFLSSIDSKIEQVQKQLNSTKEFKKALLQQMFA